MTFDRGTLLLRGPEPVRDVEGLVWDPRVEAWRAPALLHTRLTTELRGRGVDLTDDTLAEGPPPDEVPAVTLRPYQAAALDAWDLAGRRGVIVLPTGAGKTRTAIAAIARAAVRTLVLAPTRVLIEQWAKELTRAGAGPVGRYGDGERAEGPITVATYASARRHAERLGNRFALLVIDEAHHFGGLAGDETLEMCTAPFRLGLTATPAEDPERVARVERVLGPVVYRSVVGELVGRFLSPFRIVSLPLGLTNAERTEWEKDVAVWKPVVRQFFAAAPNASWPDFMVASQRSDTGRRVVAAWRRSRALLRFTDAKREVLRRLLNQHATCRTLVFAPDAITACAVSRELFVPVITADIGKKERAELLASFSRGDLRVIVSARVLNEGVDVPEADVAVILGGSQGAREYVQRVGRVLRPAEGKEAIVYELTTTGTYEGAKADAGRRGLGVE